MSRAKEFKRIGADAVFVEALPDRDAMRKCLEEVDLPQLANSTYLFPGSIYEVHKSLIDVVFQLSKAA